MRKAIYFLGFLAALALVPSGKADAIAVSAPIRRATATTLPPTIPIPSHLPQEFLILSLATFLIAALIGCVALAVGLSFRKSLSCDYADEWENPHYLRALPNVLAILTEHHFKTPWPRRCNPWSMRHFQRRLRRAIRPEFRHQSSAFAERHMALWIWLESHRDQCRRWLGAQQIEHALTCLSNASVTSERANLVAFLNASKAHDAHRPTDAPARLRFQRLQHIHLIMREHGFNLSREFAQADNVQADNAAVPAQSFAPFINAKRSTTCKRSAP